MEIEAFHFSEPMWLWGLLALPLVWAGYLLFYQSKGSSRQLEAMIDKHLLPYLQVKGEAAKAPSWMLKLLSWSIIWGCVILALAGPRWSYRDIEVLSKDQSLVVLLDLSESMDATDIKPSRLVRARQKIEDLIHHSQGTKIGLIAFAADPHMITPLTDDKETVRRMLPSLGTELVYVQGSRLSPALKMASKMLETEHGQQQAVVVISDGGFEDKSAIADVKSMADKGITVHAIGVGTVEGAPIHDSKGNVIKKNGVTILSKLERDPLQEISKVGQGFYIEPRYSPHDEAAILDKLQSNTETVAAGKQMRLWDDGFAFFLVPILPLFLYWFRKGGMLALILCALNCSSLHAGIKEEYFMNSEQVGADAFSKEHYADAAEVFQDPYRKGVAYYKAGNYAEAEKMFKESSRKEVARDAGYNLGNSLALQQKFQEAITAYEEVLKTWPEHQPTIDNLEVVKKLLEQQKQEQQDKKNQQKDDNKNNSQNKDSEKQNDKENKEQEKPSDQKDDNNQDGQSSSEKDKGEEGEPQQSPPEEKDEQQQDAKHDQPEDKESKDAPQPADMNQKPQQKSQKDIDADVWLNRLSDDPKPFLKNKFYIESKKNGTKEGIDPW